jgi:RNA polymerase sigma-70 factor (ECF subfamily)
MPDSAPDLTTLFQQWRAGDPDAASRILREVYKDLRRVAGAYMRRERPDHTLQATALVSEAWVRLANSKQPPIADRQQFFRAMAAYMRRHLVDHARRNRAQKRGAGVRQTDFDDEVTAAAVADSGEGEKDLERLDRALEALGRDHPRAAQVVNLRFFGGDSIDEVAATLGISSGTVKRDFEFAKAFLLVFIEDGS